jgi:hypothetical protein
MPLTNVTFSLEELVLFSRMAGDLNNSSRCDRLWESIARFEASNAARESLRRLISREKDLSETGDNTGQLNGYILD